MQSFFLLQPPLSRLRLVEVVLGTAMRYYVLLFAVGLSVVPSVHAQNAEILYFNPSWTPDGEAVLFEYAEAGSPHHTFIYHLASEKTEKMLDRATDASFSPDDTKITYVAEQEGTLGVFIANADATDPVRISATDRVAYAPAWTADGTSIYFIARMGNASRTNHSIYRYDLASASTTAITDDATNDYNPAPSPDGQRLLYASGAGL